MDGDDSLVKARRTWDYGIVCGSDGFLEIHLAVRKFEDGEDNAHVLPLGLLVKMVQYRTQSLQSDLPVGVLMRIVTHQARVLANGHMYAGT